MLDEIRRRLPNTPSPDADTLPLVSREWLVTNGLGGYASATVGGVNTRKYHGLLVAALPNPLGRTVMLTHLAESVVLPGGETVELSGEEQGGGRLRVPAREHLIEFRLEAGMPVWEYRVGPARIERRIVMPHRQNTTHITYRLLDGPGVRLELRPAVHFRNYEASVAMAMQAGYRLAALDAHYELASDDETLPPLRLVLHGGQAGFANDERDLPELHYRIEADRGYDATGRLWSPGVLAVDLVPGASSALIASTEDLDIIMALSPDEALDAERDRRERLLRTAPVSLRSGVAAELVLAADQFLIVPVGRRRDAVRATAEGDELRSVIAGYHWFTDWGRDTMISLEGLALTTGRWSEASSVLRTFARYVRNGLLPNMFPDGSNEGLYHTADATLWFFHALDRYATITGDRALVAKLLPVMTDIAEHHLRGTSYGIRVDPADGLLTQGAEGYQLTWMDAKVDGWVVTPRRGKAVELNALWYNALCLLDAWTREFADHTATRDVRERATRDARATDSTAGGRSAHTWSHHAERARTSFNRRFRYAEGGYLHDVVDGPDGDSIECRPNQLFAIALPNPVLDQAHWDSVLDVACERLLTPVGLRSLAPGHADYRATYLGNLRERDAAYHQGTVWGWLIGPWVDAWVKVHPEKRVEARAFLDGLVGHLDEFGVGSVAEIFDAEEPFTPRGCIAQAWSVAELLRCWALTDRPEIPQ